MAPAQVADYTILPLNLPTLPSLQLPKPATHTLYLRPHAPKISTETDSRSFFIVNIPIDSTSAHFRAIFTSLIGAGRFESISFEGEKKIQPPTNALVTVTTNRKKRKRGSDIAVEDTGAEDLPQIWDRDLHRSGSTAVVVLVDEKSVEGALKAIRKLHKSSKAKWPVWGEGIEDKIPKLGSARYATHNRMKYPDTSTLQIHIDNFMISFNNREEEAAKAAKRMRNVPDEDGFVTVTRGGRTGPARKEDAEQKRRELEEKERKKREGLENGGFYRFQVRETRKREMGELVKGFEEDRKRVEGMKKERGRFRPEK
jgi:ribosomal RNA-processing protein 7